MRITLATLLFALSLAPAVAVGPPADSTAVELEPALLQAAADAEAVDVLIYLRTTPRGGERVQEIRRRHAAGIRDMGREVREIERGYRPGGTLTEAQERQFAGIAESLITGEDRARLQALREGLDQATSAMREEVRLAIEQRVNQDQNAAMAWLGSLGIEVTARVEILNAVAATVPSSRLPELAASPRVRAITLSRETLLDLSVSMQAAGHRSWPAGLDGGPFDAGMVDTGVQQDNPVFANVNFFTDQASPTDPGDTGHGTAVAGIMISSDPDLDGDGIRYDGGAPGLDKLFWSVTGGEATTMANIEGLMNMDADKPDVVNWSGSIGEFLTEDYRVNDSFYDAFVEFYDVMFCKGAGNFGPGPSTLGNPSSAYNILVTGNMNDQRTPDRSDDNQSDTTSEGPTFGGRRKPDLTAPGHNLTVPHDDWSGTDLFRTGTGSSFATPHTASGIVLLSNGGNVSPLAQKAVLINTADWWSSNGTPGVPSDDFRVTTSGGASKWDPIYGWGYLDMAEAYTHRGDYFEDVLTPRNDDAVENDYKLYAGQMLAGEKATMTWWKRSDYIAGAASTTTYALSDLRLRLYDETDGADVDWDLSQIDNVLQVQSNATRSVVIKPFASDTTFDGASEEAFALATEENFVEVDFPDAFTAHVNRPADVSYGGQMTIDVTFDNAGAIASHANAIELTLPAGWSLVSGAAQQNVGSIAAGGTSPAASWTVEAPLHADTTAPMPDPMTFDGIAAPSSGSLQLTATTATDTQHPVQYRFAFLGSPSGGTGGNGSAWQNPTQFTDSGLQPNRSYCYAVQARDVPPVQTDQLTVTHTHDSYDEQYSRTYQAPVDLVGANETGVSTSLCLYTLAETPAPLPYQNVSPDQVTVDWGPNGNASGTEYRIQNVNRGTNSGWTTTTAWTESGLDCATQYTYVGQARNADGVATGAVSFGNVTTGGDGTDFDNDGTANCADFDDDDDGVADAGDCARLDAGAFAVPDQVTGVRFDDKTTMAWHAPQVLYGSATTVSVMRGVVGQWPVGAGGSEACVIEGVTGAETTVPNAPSPGVVFYFLARAENVCGLGGFGATSSGAPRDYVGCD